MTAFAIFCAGFGCGVLALFLILLAYREPSARCASPSPDEGYPSMPIIDELNNAAQAITNAKAAAASLPQAQDVADTLSAVSSAAQAVVLASTVTPPPS